MGSQMLSDVAPELEVKPGVLLARNPAVHLLDLRLNLLGVDQ